jgi:hypothetical protein
MAGGTRGAAQPSPERASRPAGRRGRPGGDASAANRARDLDAQQDGDAGARRLGQLDAPAVLRETLMRSLLILITRSASLLLKGTRRSPRPRNHGTRSHLTV